MLPTIVEWISNVVASFLEIVVDWVMKYLQMDLNVFVAQFPILTETYEIFRSVALGLVLAIATFQLMKYFLGQIAEVRESPATILIRAGISTGLVFFGGYAVEWVMNVAKLPYDAMLGLDASKTFTATGTSFVDFLELSLDGAISGFAGAQALFPVIALMLGIIAWNVIKLVVEVFERFVMVGILVFSAPLAFSTFTSKSTQNVLRSWFSMFISQCLLMTLSVWTLKLIINGFAIDTEVSSTTYIMRYLMTLALCKIAQRIDSYLQNLGLNAAVTGGNLLDETIGLFTSLQGTFSRRSGGGGSGESVLGGSSRSRVGGLLGNAGRDAWTAGVASYVTARNSGKGIWSSFRSGSGAGWDNIRTNPNKGKWTYAGPFSSVVDPIRDARAARTAAAAEAAQENAKVYARRNAANGSASSVDSSGAAVYAATKAGSFADEATQVGSAIQSYMQEYEDKTKLSGAKITDMASADSALREAGATIVDTEVKDANGNTNYRKHIEGSTATKLGFLENIAGVQDPSLHTLGANTLERSSPVVNEAYLFGGRDKDSIVDHNLPEMQVAARKAFDGVKLADGTDLSSLNFKEMSVTRTENADTPGGTVKGGHVLTANLGDATGVNGKTYNRSVEYLDATEASKRAAQGQDMSSWKKVYDSSGDAGLMREKHTYTDNKGHQRSEYVRLPETNNVPRRYQTKQTPEAFRSGRQKANSQGSSTNKRPSTTYEAPPPEPKSPYAYDPNADDGESINTPYS